ncbi:MAG: glycosyltransferase family 2 protein [Chlamydiota bacterium]
MVEQKPIFANSIAVIPCFNAGLFCEKVIRDTIPFVGTIIVVDDGSTDQTNAVLKKLLFENSNIHLIAFQKNRGKGFALIEAFQYALKNLNFEYIVTIDADGQHDPRDVVGIEKEIQSGSDMSIGTRRFSEMPLRSRVANTIILGCLRWFYKEAPYDTQSGFRAFTKNFIHEITKKIEGGRYETEFSCLLLALEQKRKITAYPIATVYIEKNRHSHFCVFRDSYRILKVLWKHVRKKG